MYRIMVFAMLLSAQGLAAQPLHTGNWQGEVTMHGEQPTVALFRVKQIEDSDPPEQVITMFYNERPYVFEALRFEGRDMLFTLDTGVKYQCRLSRQEDGSYNGRCIFTNDNNGERIIRIAMDPPLDNPGTDGAVAQDENAEETPAETLPSP